MRDLASGGTFETAARISLNESNDVVSVGDIALVDAVSTTELFHHQRIAISDFACAVNVVTMFQCVGMAPGSKRHLASIGIGQESAKSARWSSRNRRLEAASRGVR